MSAIDDKERAVELLAHYLEQAGVPMTHDVMQELTELVNMIVRAAVEEAVLAVKRRGRR